MKLHCLGSCGSDCPHNGDKVQRYAKKMQAPAKFTTINNNNNNNNNNNDNVVFITNLLKQNN